MESFSIIVNGLLVLIIVAKLSVFYLYVAQVTSLRVYPLLSAQYQVKQH